MSGVQRFHDMYRLLLLLLLLPLLILSVFVVDRLLLPPQEPSTKLNPFYCAGNTCLHFILSFSSSTFIHPHTRTQFCLRGLEIFNFRPTITTSLCWVFPPFNTLNT
uniref:(northern house mosquito) hypothetical protein n=1 Tax=Culex pipiens TaxID=7175 RepID=A0A8D8EZK1_CULPI